MKTLDIHILQAYPPSNPNRDANGDPKSVVFGGVRRGRISSQSLKRAMRTSMEEAANVGILKFGVRTKIRDRIEEALAKIMSEDDAASLANATWNLLDGKNTKHAKKISKKRGEEPESAPDESDEDTEKSDDNAMLFVDRKTIPAIVEWAQLNQKALLAGDKSLKSKLVAILKEYEAVDIALFGRMIAKAQDASVDGATFVAHAFSVNRLVSEVDFFTAVDDLFIREKSDDGEAQVGMIGQIAYNASVYYRNLVLDIDQLAKNLGESGNPASVESVAKEFLRAAIESYPTGMNKSHGKPSLPAFVFVIARNNHRTTNLCDAFLKPVSPAEDHDVLEVAVRRLVDHYACTVKTYPSYVADKAYLVSNLNFDLQPLNAQRLNLDDLYNVVGGGNTSASP